MHKGAHTMNREVVSELLKHIPAANTILILYPVNMQILIAAKLPPLIGDISFNYALMNVDINGCCWRVDGVIWCVCMDLEFQHWCQKWWRLTQRQLGRLCTYSIALNTLRPRQNGRHFPDDIFNSIFLNENVSTPIKFSLKFVLKGPIDNIPALVQIMAWRRLGDKPLSEQMIVRLLTHLCVTRPQCVNA